MEVTGDREPDGPAGVRPDPRGTRPRQRGAHVDDLEGQIPYVPVGLQQPREEVRYLLRPVHDEAVGQLYGPDLALPELADLLPRILAAVVIEHLQHLGREEVEHVLDAGYGPKTIHLVAVDEDDGSRRVRFEVSG